MHAVLPLIYFMQHFSLNLVKCFLRSAPFLLFVDVIYNCKCGYSKAY